MPDICVVAGCRSRGRFGFPWKDPELMQKWLVAIRRESIGENGRICDAHFHPSDLKEGMMSLYSVVS